MRTTAALALLCCLVAGVAAAEAQAASAGTGRGLRRAGRGVVRRRAPGRLLRTDRLVDSDDDYLVNVEKNFRGRSLRDQGFASEARTNNRDRDYGADTDLRASEPYSLRGRNSDTSRYTDDSRYSSGRGASNFDAGRDRDSPERRPQALRAAADTGLALTDSQRWVNILEEFLKTSKEGRDLLRVRADQLGVSTADGRLPLPLLLVPVAVPGDQCNADLSAPKTVPPPPPVDYLPPDADAPAPPPSLLELFLQATPRAPLLPPMLLPESPPPAPPAPLPPLSDAQPPSRLSFTHSLFISAELTVYYSDFTVPYTVWYDAKSGSSRVDMHGGTTVLYRSVQPGGDVQRVQLRIERYDDEEERRSCTRLSSGAVDADLLPPGLPDPAPFRFAGYNDTAEGRLERWTYELAGQVGELGAAAGEALLYRHELLVARLRPDFAIPYKYRVTVDSSLLGAAVDWYEHRYLEVREQQPDARYMTVDVSRDCDAAERSARLEHVDALREFVITHRDSRCDADFDTFKESYAVRYENHMEEAIRKTLFIRARRFVDSANCQGSTTLLEVNHLCVLLPQEKQLLLGLEPEESTPGAAPFQFGGGGGGSGIEQFPHSESEVAGLVSNLTRFSWNRKGGVTHIRNQGACRTCWAFATAAAVEGALFRETGRLVPLSDQQVADCADGPHTCARGNAVRHGFRSMRASGAFALDEYPRYNYDTPKVQQCRKEDGPVVKLTGYVKVPSNANALKVAIAYHGPTVVEVDGGCESFMYFSKGVLRDRRCNPESKNHAVTAVGFSRHKTAGDYFINKNSWGLSGKAGYVHLAAADNTAGVYTAPSYPVLAGAARGERDLDSLQREFPDERSIFNTNTEDLKSFQKDQKEFLAKEKRDKKKNLRS